MLSSVDLETLIASKKREIEREKALLGLSPSDDFNETEDKENDPIPHKKQVNFKEDHQAVNLSKPAKEKRILSEKQHNEKSEDETKNQDTEYQFEDIIPPDLERYIRRYVGLPGMLKAGEYSPNNPLLRGDRISGAGDALLGLGEYERRRNTLRKIRQAQYRQYLDQQAKKNQEAKEQAERERREREQKEREREERERQMLLERERYTPERRRASVCNVPISNPLVQTTKVDTGVQVYPATQPLSVAVQTDDNELYRLSPPSSKCPPALTQAERELSPRAVGGDPGDHKWEPCERRRSYGDFDERTGTIKRSNRDKLLSELRHSYMPAILDADAIQLRNLQAEKEAAARRQFYQQELKNQIQEQQRIREERKTREKMLEQAEMRRLEEQLRMLRVARDRERNHLQHSTAMKHDAEVFESKRTELQKEIDVEQQNILRAASLPPRDVTKRFANTSKSDTQRSKLPFFYPTEKTYQPTENEKKPYSFNIPDNSVFSANYDVDSYLRKNLNFRETDLNIEHIANNNSEQNKNHQVVVEKAQIHEPKAAMVQEKHQELDNISIPVLRHSPKTVSASKENSTNLSDAMKKIDDKWKVPAVQKNILKTLPSEDGKSISILTQLGSIRRQLQLEQLKLDKMLTKEDS